MVAPFSADKLHGQRGGGLPRRGWVVAVRRSRGVGGRARGRFAMITAGGVAWGAPTTSSPRR